jgi:coenzyme F420-0:L-glutamate ligase/coenzyme F420-1:gamma-L-glutamate ligase
MSLSVSIVAVSGMPEIAAGADLPALILSALRQADISVADGDIFVVAQKIVSKAEGRLVRLDSVTPGTRALEWAKAHGKDARVVELVLREAKDIVAMERGIIIARTRHGFVCANAGVDTSNAGQGLAILLPEDCDASAAALQAGLKRALGVPLGVIVSDTFGRPWREGLVNVALGVAGLAPLRDYRGMPDSHGTIMNATVIAEADEIASAAELVMRKTERIPVVIVRGLSLDGRNGSGRDLIRPIQNDLFARRS